MTLLAIDYTETPGYGLKKSLCISHIVVTLESALGSYICQSHYGTPFIERILLVKHAQQLMERQRGNIQSLTEEIVIGGLVRLVLSYIRRHSDGMEHEIELPAELLHGTVHKGSQIFHGSGIGRDNLGIALLCELIYGSEPY